MLQAPSSHRGIVRLQLYPPERAGPRYLAAPRFRDGREVAGRGVRGEDAHVLPRAGGADGLAFAACREKRYIGGSSRFEPM